MDKGAARSRKAAAKLIKADHDASEASASAHQSRRSVNANAEAGPSKPSAQPHPSRKEPRHKKTRPEEQSRDPALYTAKAIRDASALIWRHGAFPLPPPADVLRGVRRVDLEGSGVRDISWLKGAGVTWLSLSGCGIERGWDAVGSLAELSGAWACDMTGRS